MVVVEGGGGGGGEGDVHVLSSFYFVRSHYDVNK